MNIRKLTREEIIKVYEEYMIIDFPRSEIKPLEIILNRVDKHRYMAYGLFNENELMGYSFLAMTKDDTWMLLDYFAIYNKYRSLGHGSLFLNLLFAELGKTKAKAIIIEIEKIDAGNSEEDIILRTRRKEFYMKNKVISTDCFATIFDTEFEILYYPLKEQYDSKKIMEEYSEIYQMMLSKKLYKENCFI